MDTVLGYLRRLVAVDAARGESDHELLRRFTQAKDESAFCALLERHGSMVLGVCRRVLRNEQDAEDALQATFLLFVRNATSIRRADSLRSWLYGVAFRTACKARSRLSRQRATELQAAESASASTEPTWSEVQAVLDEELNRLPEKYRNPILLCCLEGKSRDEAAQELGWKQGAVKIRLERGRELLRQRLAARGVTLSLVLGVLLAEAKAAPVRVMASVADVGLKYAGGMKLTELASVPVRVLVEGASGPVVSAKVTVFALMCVLGISVGSVVFALGYRTLERRVEVAPVGGVDSSPESLHSPAIEQAEVKQGPILSAVVRGVDAATLTFRMKEMDRRLAVRPTATILIDGKAARLGDLKSSYRVQVTLSEDESEILRVVANGPVVTCFLPEIDGERRTITVVWKAGESRKTLRTFPVVAGESELKPGIDVVLHLSVDQKSVLKVVAK